jgi:hypothetical protein
MFCCKRFVKRVNENFKYFDVEIENLKADIQHLQAKQLQTKKNLVKIIDTFTLNEYVLFKTRLLTKKQTVELVSELYEHYSVAERYRDSDGLEKLKEDIKNDKVDVTEGQQKMILTQMNALKGILDKLEEPKLKDSDYALAKAKWCLLDQDNSDFLNTVIKLVKQITSN